MIKKLKWYLLLVACLLTLGFASELFRDVLASFFWHVRHGSFLYVANYKVRVPTLWFVDAAGGSSAELGRAHIAGLHKRAFESRVTVSVLPRTIQSLDLWERNEQELYKKEGASIARRREIQLGPQRQVVCLEGNLAHQYLKLKDASLVSADCQSNERLSLFFTGTAADLEEFYTLVNDIRGE